MAKIKINGDSSGYVEIAAPNAAHNNTLELGPGTKILTDKNTHTGNIGIGTDNPLRKLDILGTGRPVEIGSTNATNIVKLYNSATGRSTYNGVDIQSNSTAGGIISAYGGYLDLRTSSNNGSDATSRLRITSDGKIAIGFNAPAVAGLSISNSSTNRGFEFDTGSGFDSTSCIRAYDRPTTAYKSLGLTGSDIKFGINDVEKVRIDSSGRLLVGTDSTIFDTGFGIGNLQVTDKTGFQHVLISGHSAAASNATCLSVGRSRGSQSSPGYLSSGDHIARFSATSYNGGNYQSSGCIDFYAADQHASDDLPGYIVFKTVPDGSATLTERLRITSSGYIGAGTASPRRHFHIHETASATVGFQMTNAGTGASNDSQGFQLKVGSDGHAEIAQMENSNLRFFTNATERVRITSEGRLHLGNSGHANTKVGGQSISGQDYSALLKLYDTRANIWGMQMRRDTGTGPNGIFVRAGNTSSNYSLYVCGTNESNTHLVCRGDGNVGVNTKDPAESLHIVGAVRRNHSTTNTKFLEFSFELPTGSTTTIATVTGPVVSSMAIATFEYVGLYDYSGSDFYSGIEMASLRRSNNNSAYTYLQNSEIHAGGNNSSYQPNIFWQNGSNNTSDLMITTGSYVLIMGTIRITTHNLGLNRVLSD